MTCFILYLCERLLAVSYCLLYLIASADHLTKLSSMQKMEIISPLQALWNKPLSILIIYFLL